MNSENKHNTVELKISEAREKLKLFSTSSREDEKQVLRKRAQMLSVVKETPGDEETIEVLQFQLAGEVYAFETKYIKEACSLKDITPLPLTPAYLKGIISIRGEIISVIDIKNFFELPASGITDLNWVIILYHADMVFGILADRITGSVTMALKSLHTNLLTLKGIREEYLKGISAERVIVLDALKLLEDKKLIINEEI